MTLEVFRTKLLRELENYGARLDAYTDEPGHAVIELVVQGEDGIIGSCDLYDKEN